MKKEPINMKKEPIEMKKGTIDNPHDKRTDANIGEYYKHGTKVVQKNK